MARWDGGVATGKRIRNHTFSPISARAGALAEAAQRDDPAHRLYRPPLETARGAPA
jgi:hypothetical protein